MSLNDITYLYNKLVKLVPPNLIEILNNKADTSHNHNDLYYGKAIFDNALYNKVDKILGKELSTNDFTNELKLKLDNIDETSNNFSGDYNDLSSIPSTFTPTNHTHIESDIEDLDKYTRLQVDGFLAEKVNKVFGKVLSTNDYTDIDQEKVSNLSGTNSGDNATNSQYSGLATSKQDFLVSGSNIKSVDGQSLLGSGNIITGNKTILSLTSDIATAANTTPVVLTGLVFDYLPLSIYVFDMYMFTQAVAATTGHGFQLDVSSVVTRIGMSFFNQLATTGTISGGSSVADNVSLGVSSGVPNTALNFTNGKGILITEENSGTAQFKFRSETTAITICKRYSTIVITKIQ